MSQKQFYLGELMLIEEKINNMEKQLNDMLYKEFWIHQGF